MFHFEREAPVWKAREPQERRARPHAVAYKLFNSDPVLGGTKVPACTENPFTVAAHLEKHMRVLSGDVFATRSGSATLTLFVSEPPRQGT